MRSSTKILILGVSNLSLLVLPLIELTMSQPWNILGKEGTLEKDGDGDEDGEEAEVVAGVR